jgi:hypothetical protein
MSISIREFLLRCLPWPSDDTQGFINMHAMLTMPGGKKPWTGTPTRDVDQFLAAVHTALGWRTPPDIYFCLSRQAETKTIADGKVRAAKSQVNALAVKSVWLDIDIKDPPKGYRTLGEVIAALNAFCAHYKLPHPTALVMSGGGVHAYWFSNRPLTPAEWLPYADGLKHAALLFGLRCDAGVTADAARVLRVPGTFNMKQQPARPVKLLGMKDNDYDFAKDLSMLPALASASIPKAAAPNIPGRPSVRFEGVPVESLAEGIKTEYPPVDWKPLVNQCGWFREALSTGGKDFSQGLWNLTTLAATFMEHGHALAHKMAKGHPGYSVGTTDDLWERKTNERRIQGLGWPSCRSIQAEGCQHCATCPQLARGKSPLHLAGVQQQVPAQPPVVPGVPTFVANSPLGTNGLPLQLIPLTTADLPEQYIMHKGRIHRVVEHKVQGQPPTTEYVKLFDCDLYDPWVQVNPDALNFITSVDKGSYRRVNIPRSQMTTTELERALLMAGVTPHMENLKYVKWFIMSWQSKLCDAAAAQKSVPYGWFIDGNVCKGFSYGGVLYKADGTQGPIGTVDPALKEMYMPQGDPKHWRNAFKMITDQHRPGLECIVASAFGSPLMFGAAEYAVLMSVFGESGAGKSSAARVACAVWAKPKISKEVETATVKSVINRLGQIKNLPYFWDEIKNEPAQKKAYDVLYVSTAGAEGSRLNQNVTQREKGDWQTICGIFSNPSFGNYVLKENPNTTAGLMRLFEWHEAKPAVGAPGQISTGDAARMLDLLDYNFGMVGREYAEFIGPNREYIYQKTVENSHYFENAVKDPTRNTNDERFWIAFACAVQTGAELANAHLGLNFDTIAMKKFLVDKIFQQRTRSFEENMQGGSAEWTEQKLTEFLKYEMKNTIRTDQMPVKPGQPTPINIISPPMQFCPVHVHWVIQAAQLRISQAELYRYLRLQEVNGDTRAMREGLKKHYGATVAKGSLAQGTSHRAGAEQVVTIPVTQGTMLWTLMTNT